MHSSWIKPTDALNSKFIGITTLHVSGGLSAHHQAFLAVHRQWYIYVVLMTVCYQEQDPVPDSKWSSKLHEMYHCRCTAKNSWWWAERPPETCRVVIPINLEFSAYVGFIHKEFVTMHGRMMLKLSDAACQLLISNYSWRSQIRCLMITVTGFCLRIWHQEGSRKWKMIGRVKEKRQFLVCINDKSIPGERKIP